MAISFALPKDVDSVFDILTDPDFIVERGKAMGESNITAETYEDESENVVVEMSRVVERDLPSFLAKIFSAKQTLHFKEIWEETADSWFGQYTVEVDGQPVVITATFELNPTDEGSVYNISFKAKASIPMVGKKVEKFILSQTEDGVKAEMDFLLKKLS